MAGPRILIGCTGSVASIKIPLLVERLRAELPEAELKIVATQRSLHFFDALHVKTNLGVEVATDAEEWSSWSKVSDPVLHIELRNWADMLVIAPLDANTLAKIAGGMCDNLLTCTLRAWPPSDAKPVYICPAMNTAMWEHRFTAKHLDVCTAELGYRIIPPVSKKLACGDIGVGAMAEVPTIVATIVEAAGAIAAAR
ncbi:flavoprotein [Hyaloraphidium curvatum]|nr:flavoprotein [Hyaloraphidium curvatum]